MAIDPPSDIILDVARAADPERAGAVAQRLNALGANAPNAVADFSAALQQAGAARPTAATNAVNMRTVLMDRDKVAADKAAKAKEQFEAVLLTNFVGEMLPKDAPTAFGGGMAGDMWRSMLSEKIANELAKSGALGISRRLFEGRMTSASAEFTHAASAAKVDHTNVTLTSANDLSSPGAAKVADGAYLFSSGKAL